MGSTIEETITYETGLYLLYLLSLLRGDAHFLPEVSIDEWKKLLNALRSHWIIPLLYYKIGNSRPGIHPPGEIRDQMRTAFLMSRIQSLKIESQLKEILSSFNRKGIDVIVLKGPALALSIYPDPATRPYGDLDLLVRDEDFVTASGLLEEIGYKSKISKFSHLKDFNCEEVFIHQRHPDKNIMVELHWDLYVFLGNKGKLNIEDLFRRSVQFDAPSVSFKVLDPIDTVIACVLHMTITHSNDIRLLSLYDIALLLQKITDKHTWQILLERSVELNARIGLEKTIKMAQLWTGLNLPADFIDFHKWPVASDGGKTVVTNVKRIIRTVINRTNLTLLNHFKRQRISSVSCFQGLTI